jgi:hypothetical protein
MKEESVTLQNFKKNEKTENRGVLSSFTLKFSKISLLQTVMMMSLMNDDPGAEAQQVGIIIFFDGASTDASTTRQWNSIHSVALQYRMWQLR